MQFEMEWTRIGLIQKEFQEQNLSVNSQMAPSVLDSTDSLSANTIRKAP